MHGHPLGADRPLNIRLDEHLRDEHGVSETLIAEADSWRGLHVQLHDMAAAMTRELRKHLDPRCSDAGHFVPVGEDCCDCGIERFLLP